MGMIENGRNIMATTRFLLPSLTAAEKRVAEFVLASPKEVTRMSLKKAGGKMRVRGGDHCQAVQDYRGIGVCGA